MLYLFYISVLTFRSLLIFFSKVARYAKRQELAIEFKGIFGQKTRFFLSQTSRFCPRIQEETWRLDQFNFKCTSFIIEALEHVAGLSLSRNLDSEHENQTSRLELKKVEAGVF